MKHSYVENSVHSVNHISNENSIFTGISQVAIVTYNFEKTVSNLVKYLGIGPFKCWHYKPPMLFNSKLYGQDNYCTLKVAIAFVGKMQIEVIQPLEGQSLYQEYLSTHGEGIQHLLLDTGKLSLEQSIQKLAAVNCVVDQEAMLNMPIQIGFFYLPSTPRFLANLLNPKFVYINTEAQEKTTYELLKLPPFISFKTGITLAKADYCIPEKNNKINSSLANNFIDKIFKIGIITADIEKTIYNYVEQLGISNWRIYHLDNTKLSHTQIRGKNANFSIKSAVTYVGDILLEIVQPLEGQSIYQELLEKHGEGANYIGVSSDKLSFSELIDHFSKLGFSSAMSGKLKNAYDFTWLDTKDIAKMMIEVVSIPVNKISLALESLQPDRIYPQ
jgi:hypothetical protein